MNDVFIGIGSNLGDRMDNLALALDAIAQLPDTRLLAISEVVESEPWGVAEQPEFANAVARLDTALRADALLAALKSIEARLGRTAGERYGPRPIDLDILLAGAEVWHTEDLVVPHPRLAERDFALTPLLALDPEATWPDGQGFDRRLAVSGRILRSLGPVPGFEHLTVPVATR